MTKGMVIISIFIACAAAGTVWILKTAPALRQTSTKPAAQSTLIAVKPTQNSAVAANPVQKVEETLTQQRSPALSEQLQQEQDKLIRLKQNLDNLQSRNTQFQNQVNTTYPNKITNSQIEIQNLTDTLQAERHQEGAVERSIASTADTAFRNLQSTQMQLQPRVQPLLTSREATLQRMDVIRSDPYITPTQKAVSIEELQRSLANLNEQLEILNQQSQTATANAALVEIQTAQTIQQQKLTAAENQSEILQNIFFLRSEIARLQNENRQTQSELRAMSSEIDESKLNYQEQFNKVKTIESQVR